MRNQKGFTLIELVVVIVVLGILAAVAIPKFIDLQVDARQSAVNGMLGAVRGATSLAHAQALVDGIDLTAGSGETVDMEGTVNMAFGYPDESGNGINAAINTDGFFFVAGTAALPAYFYLGTDSSRTDCRVSYDEAPSGGVPTIGVAATCAN